MAIRISQFTTLGSESISLKVEGWITAAEAQLLESTCTGLKEVLQQPIVIDFQGVAFLNEAGAAVLRRLKEQAGIAFQGCELFTHNMLNPKDEA